MLAALMPLAPSPLRSPPSPALTPRALALEALLGRRHRHFWYSWCCAVAYVGAIHLIGAGAADFTMVGAFTPPSLEPLTLLPWPQLVPAPAPLPLPPSFSSIAYWVLVAMRIKRASSLFISSCTRDQNLSVIVLVHTSSVRHHAKSLDRFDRIFRQTSDT